MAPFKLQWYHRGIENITCTNETERLGFYFNTDYFPGSRSWGVQHSPFTPSVHTWCSHHVELSSHLCRHALHITQFLFLLYIIIQVFFYPNTLFWIPEVVSEDFRRTTSGVLVAYAGHQQVGGCRIRGASEAHPCKQAMKHASEGFEIQVQTRQKSKTRLLVTQKKI